MAGSDKAMDALGDIYVAGMDDDLSQVQMRGQIPILRGQCQSTTLFRRVWNVDE